MDIREQINWLRTLADDGYSVEGVLLYEPADTMEKLLAVYEAVDGLSNAYKQSYQSHKTSAWNALDAAVDAVQTRRESIEVQQDGSVRVVDGEPDHAKPQVHKLEDILDKNTSDCEQVSGNPPAPERLADD